MSLSCFYHPLVTTETNCVQCGIPVCGNCREAVAGRNVCKNCVGAIRARVQAELDQQPVVAQTAATSTAYASSASAGEVRAPYAAPPKRRSAGSQANGLLLASEVSDIHPGLRLAMGAGAGLLAGLVGAMIWEKFVFYTGFNIGYLTAAIGFAVGYAIVWASKQAGVVPGLFGAVITLFAQIFGYYMLVNDTLARDMGGAHAPFLDVLQGLPRIVSPLGWIIIAIGVWLGYKTPMRAAGHMD